MGDKYSGILDMEECSHIHISTRRVDMGRNRYGETVWLCDECLKRIRDFAANARAAAAQFDEEYGINRQK